MGLHICQVANRTTDRRGEYVHVANDGSTTVNITGLELTDYTTTQQHVHIYRFPGATNGEGLTLRAGQSAYVFTGTGTNARNPDGNFILYAGRRAAVWNDDGDVAYLRRPDGTFIDSVTVGHPARHPRGH